MRYPQKIDLWIGAIMLGSVLMFLPLMFVVPEDETWILILSMALLAVIVLPFFYGYIEFREDHLFIRVGFVYQRIYYDKIKSIRKVHNFLSSMAMTSQRIEIRVHQKNYFLGTTFIGPKDRDEVFDELRYRCHNLDSEMKT